MYFLLLKFHKYYTFADYKIVVRPTLATWSQAGYDTVFLQKLDLDNIRVVCSILAQSVSLEHHLRKVKSNLRYRFAQIRLGNNIK